MFRIVVRRLIAIIPVLFAVSVITFVLMHLTPGGPFDKGEGRRELPPEVRANLERAYGLDRSWPEQYLTYMANALRGDLGMSFQFRDRNVTDLIFSAPPGRPWWESRFGRSAQLGVMAFLLGTLIAIPLGVLAAVKRNSWIDYLSLFLATLGTALPSFVMAIFLILVFGLTLKWVAVSTTNWNQFAFENPATWTPWILPTATLTLGLVPALARYTRGQMLEALGQDYIRTARSKGLRETVVLFRHALKNAMIPVATILGPTLAALLTGTLFVETIFSFPGMGRMFVTAITSRDYAMIMGLTLFFTFMYVLGNLLVDIVYGWLDPRIKVGV